MAAILSEILAARLVIPDAAGTPRIVLGLDDHGDPSIRLFDRAGEERAHLALEPSPLSDVADGPITTALFYMSASDGGAAISLMAQEHGSGTIEMTNAEDNRSATTLLEVERFEDGNHARLVLRDGLASIVHLARAGEVEFHVDRL